MDTMPNIFMSLPMIFLYHTENNRTQWMSEKVGKYICKICMLCKIGSCDVKYMTFVVNKIKYAKALAWPFNENSRGKPRHQVNSINKCQQIHQVSYLVGLGDGRWPSIGAGENFFLD